MRSNIFIGTFFGLIFLSSAYADEIRLTNGDRLTGEIDNLVGGKLTLKSDLAGTVTIDISNIRTITSNAPLEIHLKDGSVLNERITPAEPVELSTVDSINPPPKPKPRWHGEISAGYNSAHGNTNTDNINASASLKKRTEKDRTKVSGDYAKSREKDETSGKKETIEDWWKVAGNYDYFLTKKLFAFAEASYETDDIADLERRVILGGGLGYQWIESEQMNFSTRAGLASLYEKFENQGSGGSELVAHLGYDFDKQLRDNIQFIHNLKFYPAVDKLSDYFLTSTAEIKAGITENIFTSFKVLFDYDATPAADSGNTDVKYILSVGAEF
jgi:putative salt-induced outer membrane protein YdiY